MANVKIDDRDPRIQYSGQWIQGGTSNEYDDTTTGSAIGYSGATATFTFSGTSVAVFGTITSHAISTYTLDGEVVFTLDTQVNSTVAKFETLFFASTQLQDGEHTLVITSEFSGGTLWLDFITYTPSQATTSSSPAVPTSAVTTVVTTSTTTSTSYLKTSSSLSSLSTSPTSTSQATTSNTSVYTSVTNGLESSVTSTSAAIPKECPLETLYPSTTSVVTVQPTTSSKASKPVAAIAGGAVIAFMGFAILFGICFLMARRRRRRQEALDRESFIIGRPQTIKTFVQSPGWRPQSETTEWAHDDDAPPVPPLPKMFQDTAHFSHSDFQDSDYVHVPTLVPFPYSPRSRSDIQDDKNLNHQTTLRPLHRLPSTPPPYMN